MMHATHTSSIEDVKKYAMIGNVSDDEGSLSWMSSKNTVMDSKTVICKEIFSLQDGGRQNPMKVRLVTRMHGKIMVIK